MMRTEYAVGPHHHRLRTAHFITVSWLMCMRHAIRINQTDDVPAPFGGGQNVQAKLVGMVLQSTNG